MMERQSRGADVAVIGSGAAGLIAALALAERGLDVHLIEARDRVGGRVLTHPDPSLRVPLELGPEFIHGHAPLTRALLASAGGFPLDTAGQRWTLREGRLTPRPDVFGDVRRLMQRVESLSEPDLSVEEFLARCADDPSLEPARAYARMMVEGFDAADPRRASVRAIAEEWSGMDGGQSRPSEGYGALVAWLARALVAAGGRIQLQTIVDSVDWTAGEVRIGAAGPAGPVRITARCALITLPVSLLQLPAGAPGAVRFTPPLTEKSQALKGVALGPVVKVVLRFRHAFWETLSGGRYRDAGFLHAPDSSFPTLWTALPVRVPVITAWTGGPRAQRLSSRSREEIVGEALASVRSVFGLGPEVRDDLAAAYTHDWQRDPYSLGAYSYITVGGGSAPEALAQPLAQTLFFAGEAANAGESGTVEAALQSGRRAAHEIAKQFANSAPRGIL
jgi:monoamine oxidase